MARSLVLFFHAGCPVCRTAEQALVGALDPARYQVEVVHLGQTTSRIAEARTLGVVSVPAVVIDGAVLHLNFGATLEAVAG
jgi:glutaredoxin